ncbi:MAG TPA: SRPBCC family protein [Candidatus Krumholzibacteria bacterium]|nr:SRPBCC family protein [Candidatus Krumholzibacteria bacterium]
MARRYRFEQTQIIPRPRAEVFAFFSEAQNLERLTPSFLGFEILTPGTIEMKPRTIIDYKLRLYGFSVKWKTRIEVFEPESHFVDTQLKGPYRYWHHLHEFEEVEEGTRMRDLVHYELPFGALGVLAHTFFVQHSLRRIFGFRRQVVDEIFGSTAP